MKDSELGSSRCADENDIRTEEPLSMICVVEESGWTRVRLVDTPGLEFGVVRVAAASNRDRKAARSSGTKFAAGRAEDRLSPRMATTDVAFAP